MSSTCTSSRRIQSLVVVTVYSSRSVFERDMKRMVVLR
jgi:hypothetical protein